MTFDREPDLDNANVGMPDTRILGITKYTKAVTKSVAYFFVAICGLDGLGSNIAISLARAGIGKLLLLKIR